MTWLRIDDAIADHPKLRDAGPRASWLYICALCYCSRYLTDGFVPDFALPGMGGLFDAKKLASAAAEAGLWVREDNGYRIPDYLDFNPSKTTVETKRAKERARKTPQPALESTRNPQQVDGPPAPSPLPLVVEVVDPHKGPEGEEFFPASGPSSNGKKPHPARFDHEQSVLLGKILERRPKWLDRLRPSGITSLNKDFGYAPVFEAMQELEMRLKEGTVGQVKEPFPYLRGMIEVPASSSAGREGN